MQPVIECLSQEKFPVACLPQLDLETRIPTETLKSWRHDLRSDPPHVPWSHPANIGKRALSEDQEHELAQRIQSDYIDHNRYCQPVLNQRMGLRLHAQSKERAGVQRTMTRQGEDLNDIVARSIRPSNEALLPPGARDRRPLKATR
jgi:hypothetical protein